MFSVRIHGRGGQGVVTAAELLAVAAFAEERYAQAFPSFGSERTGAPVAAFCRVDDRPIRSHEPVVAPDAVLVADPTVMHQVDVLAGLRPDGYLLVNSARSADQFARPGLRVTLVPATELAMRHIGRALPNAVLLGAFAALTGVVRLDSVCVAIRERFPSRIAESNIAAATAAWHHVHNGLKVNGMRVAADA